MNLFEKAFEGSNMKTERDMIYGVHRGFYTHAAYVKNLKEVTLGITFTNYPGANVENIYRFMEYAKSMEPAITFTKVSDFDIEVRIGFSNAAKTAETTRVVADNIISFLKTEGFGSGCESCGSNDYISMYEIGGGIHPLCPGCANRIGGQFEAAKQGVNLKRKSNLFTGLIGALIGSLIGVVLWVGIYQAGYIASIAGLAIVVCAMKGYELLGRSLDGKGIFFTVLLSIVMVFIANQVSWTVSIVSELETMGYDYTFKEVFTNMFGILEYYELTTDFYKDLGIGYLLSLVGSASTISRAVQNQRGSTGSTFSMRRL